MVMGVIWAGFLIFSLIFSIGQGTDLSGAALEGARRGLELGLSLAGPLCLWSGFSRVMEISGMSRGLSRLTAPVLGRLFPGARKDPEAFSCISANVTANLLGLGNAATPPGIRAVRRMQALSGGTAATDEMCRFIVLNTASVQVLPTTVAALRASLGSGAAFDILPAVWLTSLCSVTGGLLCARLLGRCYE